MLIPCIDLQAGQAVQLVHGKKRELAVPDVFAQLHAFKNYNWLHIIDLDAAMGQGSNEKLARELCAAARNKYKMQVRIGGGIRTVAHAQKIAAWRPHQIIIGSAAFKEGKIANQFLCALTAKIDPRQIVIALDTANSKITIKGWQQKLKLSAEEVMPQLEPYCSAFLCTDVDPRRHYDRRHVLKMVPPTPPRHHSPHHRRRRHQNPPRNRRPGPPRHGRRRRHGHLQKPPKLNLSPRLRKKLSFRAKREICFLSRRRSRKIQA